jgi:hypothetical protein
MPVAGTLRWDQSLVATPAAIANNPNETLRLCLDAASARGQATPIEFREPAVAVGYQRLHMPQRCTFSPLLFACYFRGQVVGGLGMRGCAGEGLGCAAR